MTATEMPNVCNGCPAAHALGTYRDELIAEDDQTMRGIMRLADAEGAVVALNEAAGAIACQDIVKKLPPLRDNVGEVGKLRLIFYVNKCPAFKPSMKLRLQKKGASEEMIAEYDKGLEENLD